MKKLHFYIRNGKSLQTLYPCGFAAILDISQKISIIQNGMSNLLHIFPFEIQLSEKCIPVLMLVIRKPILVTHFGSQILKYPKWSDFKK